MVHCLKAWDYGRTTATLAEVIETPEPLIQKAYIWQQFNNHLAHTFDIVHLTSISRAFDIQLVHICRITLDIHLTFTFHIFDLVHLTSIWPSLTSTQSKVGTTICLKIRSPKVWVESVTAGPHEKKAFMQN